MKAFGVTKKEFQVITADLKKSSKYCGLLEQAKANPQGAPSPSTNEALSLAMVVAYCRPFTPCDRRNHRTKDKKSPWIPKGLVAQLPDEELRRLHAWVMKLRHKTWAHSDEDEFKNLIQAYPKAKIGEFKRLLREVQGLLQIED
jgi:hypothetical protein